MTNRTTAYDGDFRLIGQWPPLPAPRPRQHPTPYPMAPTTAAVWAIVLARRAELWPMIHPLEFILDPWLGDPLADVRRELQAWLDGPTCPQRHESPWVGVMARRNVPDAHEAVFGHGFSVDCLVFDE